jgi:hypothetical protein
MVGKAALTAVSPLDVVSVPSSLGLTVMKMKTKLGKTDLRLKPTRQITLAAPIRRQPGAAGLAQASSLRSQLVPMVLPAQGGWAVVNILGSVALALMLSSTAFGADPPKESASPATNSGAVPHHNPAVSTDENSTVATADSIDEQQVTTAQKETETKEPKATRTGHNPKASSTEAADSGTNAPANWLASKAALRGSLTGGLDPHGDSLVSIQNSFQQFAHPSFVLRLFLSLTLSVLCSSAIAWHPRRWSHAGQMFDPEERKAFIILGVVGAIVAELSGTNPTLAFVIFGIGALLRFRTLLDNPKSTGKAVLVVVIGLACGMGSWTMAVFVTVFSCVLLFWLESRLTGTMTIRLNTNRDSKTLQDTVESFLISHRCHPHCFTVSKGKKRMELLFDMPADIDREKLEAELATKLPKNGDTRVSIDLS